MKYAIGFLYFLLLSCFSISILLGQEITQVAGTASLEKAKKKETASLTVAIRQTSGPNPVTTAGQIITYKIIVSNTGTKKIKNVNTTETYPGDGKGTLSPARESISNNNVLDVGETWRYTATYTVTAGDISAGSSLVNTISVVTIQVPGPTIVTATTEVASPIIPTFAQIGPLCQNSKPPVLPSTSTNGITGIWKPSTISTTIVGIKTYTFTPKAGQRASTTTMNIVVILQVIPTFTQIGPLCRNSTPPALPTNSNNTAAIIGIWSPATISTATIGTTTYTFTPSAEQCAMTTTLMVTVNSLPTVSFITQPDANSSIGVDVTYTTQPGMTNYIWGFPGTAGVDYSITSGGTVGDNIVVLKYLTPGYKIVTINYTSGGCTATSATSSTATVVNALSIATTTTVTVSDAIYDGSPHGGTAVVTGAGGFTQTLTVIYTGVAPTVYGPTSTAPTNAGTYSVTASFAGNNNYNASSATAVITIVKMVVGVKADPKIKIYGQVDPALTYQITSGTLLNGDDFSGHLTRDAGENVGAYAIRQETLALGSNYTIAFTEAQLTITPLPVIVTADPKFKVIGEVDPPLTFVSIPAVGAVMANGNAIYFTGSLSRDAGESIGFYQINQGNLNNSNFIITYFDAFITIMTADGISGSTKATVTTPVAGTKSLTSKSANLTGSGAANVKPILRGEFGLKAYPNPFTDHLYFELQWNKDANARIEIFNINGIKLTTLFSGDVGADMAYCFDYAPENISSGLLIYRVVIDGQIIFTGNVVHK